MLYSCSTTSDGLKTWNPFKNFFISFFFLGSVIALSQCKEKQNSGYVSDLKNNWPLVS